MKISIRKYFPLLLVFCTLCFSVSAQVATDPLTLVPDHGVEREIAGGESHTYQIKLTAGQFMRVVVEPKGIDLSVTLTALSGKQGLAVDVVRSGALESLSAEAEAGGDYRLAVRALGKGRFTRCGFAVLVGSGSIAKGMYCSAPSATITSRFLPSCAAVYVKCGLALSFVRWERYSNSDGFHFVSTLLTCPRSSHKSAANNLPELRRLVSDRWAGTHQLQTNENKEECREQLQELLPGSSWLGNSHTGGDNFKPDDLPDPL